MSLSRYLRSLGACDVAVAWAKDYATLQAAWNACPRGDWMLWLLENTRQHESERRELAYAFADRAVRVHAVAALRAAGLVAEAGRLAALAPIRDRESARAARAAAWAAWAAAEDAVAAARSAEDAAWTAAWTAWAAENKWQADAIRAAIPTVKEVQP